MSTPDELQELYLPYHNQKQTTHTLSKGVVYLGYFTGFGPVWAQHHVWKMRQQGTPKAQWGNRLLRDQHFQEKCLDNTLADLKDCVVLSTTPSYFSQFQNACLLKSRGFKLLGGLCYAHPGYSEKSKWSTEHPGIPDNYLHWEHIWWKVIGKPREIGCPKATDWCGLNNCGVDRALDLGGIKAHDAGDRKNFLAVGWLPRGTVFPKGWRRFFSAEDYKLGVNFDLVKRAQKCDHDFDLRVFEGWQPNFDKYSPL